MSRIAIAASLILAACSRNVPVIVDPLPPMRTSPIPIGQGPLPSDRYGALFCGTLAHLPNAADWGACDRYIQPTAPPADVSAAIPATYRVLVVPGIFGQCVEAIAKPFQDAVKHLHDVHGFDVETISVSALGSVAFNAKQIADYLAQQPATAKYIAFGYSKGASDLFEALTTQEAARQRIAAIVTVAGTVLGSRLPDSLPKNILDSLRAAKIGSCGIGDGGGIDSLRRVQRVNAMARFVAPAGFRAYSIASVSTEATTSAVLLNSWRTLQAYSLEEDSQMIHEDAIVPGGAYLGLAKGDHWAVALPFEDVPATDPLAPFIKASVNHNHYPRPALFEAALRFVLEDLGALPRR